jgi:hypothetical protein
MDMPDRKIFNFRHKDQGFTKTFTTETLIKTGNQARKQVIFTRHPSIWPMSWRPESS